MKNPQELDLDRGGDVADLVEQQRSAFGGREPAGFVFLGVGERPPDVSEELGFDEGLGDGAAVDPDEWSVAARPHVVDRPGDQLLAGAGFALDENGGVASGDEGQEIPNPAHGGALGDDVTDPIAALELAPENAQLGEIAEHLDPADDRPAVVLEARGAHGDRDLGAVALDDLHLAVTVRLALPDAVEEEAASGAVVGVEDRGAGFAEDLVLPPPGDLLRGAVEGRDVALGVHGEDAVRDVVEYQAAVARVDAGAHVT